MPTSRYASRRTHELDVRSVRCQEPVLARVVSCVWDGEDTQMNDAWAVKVLSEMREERRAKLRKIECLTNDKQRKTTRKEASALACAIHALTGGRRRYPAKMAGKMAVGR